MAKNSLIDLGVFCQVHQVDYEFVYSLCESGYIAAEKVSDVTYIHLKHLAQLEKIIRLHRDLHLNSDAMEIVLDLVSRIDEMQSEIRLLQNRLYLYENDLNK